MIISTKNSKGINNTKINKNQINKTLEANNTRFRFNRLSLVILIHLIVIILFLFLLLDMLFANKLYKDCRFMNELSILFYLFYNINILIILYLLWENFNDKELNNINKYKKINFFVMVMSFTIYISKNVQSHCCLNFRTDLYYYLTTFHILFETIYWNFYLSKIKNDIRNASQFLSQYQ